MSIIIRYTFIFFISSLAFAQSIPAKKNYSEIGINLFLKKSFKKFDLIAKHKSAEAFNEKYLSQTSLGLRHRFHPNYQIGLFSGVVSGERRNDDWIFKETWDWKEKKSHYEPLLTLEFRSRYDLKKIAMEQATLTFDFELIRRFKSEQNSFKWGLSPAYFFMSDFIPKYTLLLNYYQYHALNFARKTVYQKNYYLTFLKQQNSSFSFGPSIGERIFIWTESPDFSARTQGSYRVKEKALLFAFSLQYSY